MAPRKPHPRVHHARPMPRRNATDIPADVLLDLAPIAAPVQARPFKERPYRRKVAQLAQAMKPQGATVTKDHLLGVGANAAGAVVTSLAANELVDNLGVMPMAIGATVAGGLGSALLQGRWQQVAQGVLGAGMGQLGTAYLAQRGLKKAAVTRDVTPAASAPPKRNAALGSGRLDDDPADDGALARAMARTERRIDALLAAERNAAGDDGGGRFGDAYGDPYGDRFAGAYATPGGGFDAAYLG